MLKLDSILSLFLLVSSYTCLVFPSSLRFTDDALEVTFCDLPKYEGQLVSIEGRYSGVEEYWAINSLKRCKQIPNVHLDYYQDGNPIPQKYQHLFDSVHSSYWNTSLIINLTGTYESKNPNGYGHLGSNKSRFIVKDVLEVTLIKKQ